MLHNYSSFLNINQVAYTQELQIKKYYERVLLFCLKYLCVIYYPSTCTIYNTR